MNERTEKSMPKWRWLVASTWVFILMGFLNPVFFLMGVGAFLIAMVIWTWKAIEQKVDYRTILLVWGAPIVMIMFLGVGVTYLFELPDEEL